jgi:hypothetical protein
MSENKEIFSNTDNERTFYCKYQSLVSLMGSLILGRFENMPEFTSVSVSGAFDNDYTKQYLKHEFADEAWKNGDQTIHERMGISSGIISPGFGYCKETLKAMGERGFYTSPAITFVMENYGKVWDKGYPNTKEIMRHPLNAVREHFEGLGVSCFFARGGAWPEDTKDCAIVFDVSDPEFLTKIKPDFLSYFTDKKSAQLSRPNHMNTQELMNGYYIAVVTEHKEYGQKIGAIYKTKNDEVNSDSLLIFTDREIHERAQSQAKYQMGFVTEAFDAMLPVLSPEERGTLIMELARKLSSITLEKNAEHYVDDIPELNY